MATVVMKMLIAVALIAGLTILSLCGYESVAKAPTWKDAERALYHYGLCLVLSACSIRRVPGYSSVNILLHGYSGTSPSPVPLRWWLAWQTAKIVGLSTLLSGFPALEVLRWVLSGDPSRWVLAAAVLFGPVFKVRVFMSVMSQLAVTILDVSEYRVDKRLLQSALVSHGLRTASLLLVYLVVVLITYPVISLCLLPMIITLGWIVWYLHKMSRLPWKDHTQVCRVLKNRLKPILVSSLLLCSVTFTLGLTTDHFTNVSIRIWEYVSGEHVRQVHTLVPAVLLDQTSLRRIAETHRTDTSFLTLDALQDRVIVLIGEGGDQAIAIDPRTGRSLGSRKLPPELRESSVGALTEDLEYAYPYFRAGLPVLYSGKLTISGWVVADVWIPFAGYTLMIPEITLEVRNKRFKPTEAPAFPGVDWGVTWYPARLDGRIVPVVIPSTICFTSSIRVPGSLVISLHGPTAVRVWLHQPCFIEIERGRVYVLRPEYYPDGTLMKVEKIRV
ncbi:hypothetical protein [Methanopyrus sp. SNP6]|uniref:hypothetical protein n=1 Tax=Methanopyrus sp. SNP6 TaxID=1937005 RepID=UPI0011E5CBD0|nr:hypothetical protein [Methanopyrus sp. SNP6]